MSADEHPKDHALQPEEVYRDIDSELAEAEREMQDADEQLRLLHERRKNRKRKLI